MDFTKKEFNAAAVQISKLVFLLKSHNVDKIRKNILPQVYPNFFRRNTNRNFGDNIMFGDNNNNNNTNNVNVGNDDYDDYYDDIKKKIPFCNILEKFKELVIQGSVHWNHPLFLSYFPAGSSHISILADFLASGLNNNGLNLNPCPV